MGDADTDVLETLTWLGAPLAGHRPARRLPTDEALVRSLEVARHDATLLVLLPLVFSRLTRAEVPPNWGRLRAKVASSRDDSYRRELGLVFELAGKLGRASELSDQARQLHQDGDADHFDFLVEPRGPRGRELARRSSPPEARHWGFFLNMPEASFRRVFEKFGA